MYSQTAHGGMPFVDEVILLLRQLRVEKKLSQNDVSAITDVHIARIENSQQDITLSTLKSLCDLYEMSLENFFLRLENK